VGKPEQGLSLLDEDNFHSTALVMVKCCKWISSGSKADLLLALSPDNTSEAQFWFLRALESAQEQGALMYELRAGI